MPAMLFPKQSRLMAKVEDGQNLMIALAAPRRGASAGARLFQNMIGMVLDDITLYLTVSDHDAFRSIRSEGIVIAQVSSNENRSFRVRDCERIASTA